MLEDQKPALCTTTASPLPQTFTFYGPNMSEMLRIEKGAFYVRGVKVEQDASEAEAVYQGFREWMVSTGALK